MKLKYIPEYFKKINKVDFKYKNLEYYCQITYLPFPNDEKKIEYEEHELEDLLTPVFHIEWHTECKTLYKSQYIMGGAVLWFFENYKNRLTLENFAQEAHNIDDFLSRVIVLFEEKQKEALKGSQLSLF